MAARWASLALLSLLALLPGALVKPSEQQSGDQQQAQLVAPKLVCYYTSWAKDRPDPWSYVSSAVVAEVL